MTVELDQASLLDVLSHAQSIASKRGTMPILANVLLRASGDGVLTCIATDLMIGLTSALPAVVTKPFQLTVQAKHLYQVVRTLPAGRLRLEGLENHHIHITGESGEFKLLGLPESDFPSLPVVKVGQMEQVPAHALLDGLQKTLFSISADESRMNLNGVLFECDGRRATFVSTDGHRLTKFSNALSGLALNKGIVIPRRGVLELRKLLDGVSGDIALGVFDQHLFAQVGSTTLSIKLHQIAFPPYEQVIPSRSLRTIQVQRDELLQALRRVEVIAPEKTPTVRVQIQQNTLELMVDNPELGLARQQVSAQLQGEPILTGFNARYLLEAVEAVDTPRAQLEFQGELDPCVIRPLEGSEFFGVVMPMRI